MAAAYNSTNYYLAAMNRFVLVLCNATMIAIGGTLYSADAHAATPDQVGSAPDIHPESISVSLSVYVSSLIATAVFTWTVAKYDTARLRKMDRLEARLEELSQQLKGDNRS